eukprot:7224383-Pyramimonas_sp.AAC.1
MSQAKTAGPMRSKALLRSELRAYLWRSGLDYFRYLLFFLPLFLSSSSSSPSSSASCSSSSSSPPFPFLFLPILPIPGGAARCRSASLRVKRQR